MYCTRWLDVCALAVSYAVLVCLALGYGFIMIFSIVQSVRVMRAVACSAWYIQHCISQVSNEQPCTTQTVPTTHQSTHVVL